ncbi:MAG: glucosylceramidase, partial [Lachnospiraceae bacterium]|nr:glucosylceramidase [Lachnospiraceae bacterium]
MIRQIRTNLSKKQYWEESELTVLNGFEENNAVCLYPQYEDQTFLGFGGAFTEAAAYTWKNLNEESKAAFPDMYFGRDGLRYSVGRAHIGSCDFALGNYACTDDPGDTELVRFDMDRDNAYIIPLIRAADEAAGAKTGL